MAVRALLGLVVLTLPSNLLAQDTLPPAPVPADSATSIDDTSQTNRDSTTTERLLAAQESLQHRLPVIDPVGFGEVQPVGSRIVLNRDSVEWLPARTVGELVAAVAPAYLWRAGWLLRAELPNVMARGAGSVEYFRDGLPILPIGSDSVAVDPSLWSLNFIERIEIERLPGRLRVFLFSRDHDLLAPATRIAVSTGDRGAARYVGAFDKKFASGFGLSLAADYSNVDAPDGGSGSATQTSFRAQLSWRISQRLATTLTMHLSEPDRAPLLANIESPAGFPDTLDPGLSGRRTDTELRVALRPPSSTFGFRADAWLAQSGWSDDSASRGRTTVGTILAYRKPTSALELQLLHHSEWTPFDSKLAAGWAPSRWFSGSVEGVLQSHEGDRSSSYLTARVGATLPLGIRAGVVASSGDRLEAPAITEAESQSFSDYEAFVGLSRGPISLEGRWTSTDVWQPLEFRQFKAISGFERQPRIEWLSAHASLRPNSWFTLASHYEHPQGFITPDGVPPHHAWSTATINSRFLRNFPSGSFRLKVQAVVETWSPGVIGRDPSGDPIEMPGLTFVRGIIQLKIGSFTLFWDRVNFQGTDHGTVLGYQIPSLGSSYGIRWSFTN